MLGSRTPVKPTLEAATLVEVTPETQTVLRMLRAAEAALE
jgi:hypothetical protein